MIAAWWHGLAVLGVLASAYALACGINAALEVLARLLIGAWRYMRRAQG